MARINGYEVPFVSAAEPLQQESPRRYIRPRSMVIGVTVFLLFGCCSWPLYLSYNFLFPAHVVALVKSTETPTFMPSPTLTPAPSPTITPYPTYTAFPTYTPFPSPVPVATLTPTRKTTKEFVLINTPDFNATRIILPYETEVAQLAEIKLQSIKPLITATPEISAVAVMPTDITTWQAWHVVQMDVRNDPSRDGSSFVRNILLDARGDFTHTLDIKCRMSNAETDMRVNECDSQKVLFENGVPAYAFYINQTSTFDVQFYEYVSEAHAVEVSELLKLPVGKNQIIEVYWQFGATPLIDAAHVDPGPGIDNGRSAPVTAPSSGAGGRATTIVKETVIVVVTATPASTPSQTPWIIRVTNTPHATYAAPTRTLLPTGSPEPTYTPFWEVTPATCTPSPYPFPASPLTPLAPLSNSSTTVNAARYWSVYLPVILKQS